MYTRRNWPWSRIHERTISLRFLGIILIVLRLEVSVYNVYTTNQFQTTFVQGGGDPLVEVTVNSEENSEDFCPNFVQEFGLCSTLLPRGFRIYGFPFFQSAIGKLKYVIAYAYRYALCTVCSPRRVPVGIYLFIYLFTKNRQKYHSTPFIPSAKVCLNVSKPNYKFRNEKWII